MPHGLTNFTGIEFQIGTGLNTAVKINPCGLLNVNTTTTATGANTTETTGYTYTLPPNALNGDDGTNKGCRLKIWGTTGANTNTKVVKLYHGGVNFYTTGAVAANAQDFCIEATIIRTAAGTQTYFIQGHFNGAPIVASTTTTGTVDNTASEIIKATMTNGSASAADISIYGATLEVFS